ncbi:MAG: formate dehydrogenase accessory protein FdhE [Myxococcales bacterium]|nr:MAG: formate dehydrogenase accessory protein FdhE [Myxococcales bacterium]
MIQRDFSSGQTQSELTALTRRAKAILKARPAYKEMVDFYLTVFRRQIEWRDHLGLHPESLDGEQVRACLRAGTPLAKRYAPGLEPESLFNLWNEMKAIFRRGNDVLRLAVDRIDDAEENGGFSPAVWLAELRPGRRDLVSDVAARIGVAEPVLATLAGAATFPHWNLAAQCWLRQDGLDNWRRPRCPLCGGQPCAAETRVDRCPQTDISPAVRRFLHCAFCGARWPVSAITCLSCGSTKAGDAKYLFTPDEPDLRIDFCKGCRHYVKVIDGDRVSGTIHVGLELLTSAHLDTIAQEEKLLPLNTM